MVLTHVHLINVLQEKLESEFSEFKKHYQDVKDAKESLELELAEVKTNLEMEKSEKSKVKMYLIVFIWQFATFMASFGKKKNES